MVGFGTRRRLWFGPLPLIIGTVRSRLGMAVCLRRSARASICVGSVRMRRIGSVAVVAIHIVQVKIVKRLLDYVGHLFADEIQHGAGEIIRNCKVRVRRLVV